MEKKKDGIHMTAKKKRRMLRFCALVTLICSMLLNGCAISLRKNEPKSFVLYDYFDTVITVTAYDTESSFERAKEIIAAEAAEYHRLCDIYHEYDGLNNAATLNRLAGTAPVPVDPRLAELLEFGKEMYSATNGCCNIMMGAVLKLWHTVREAVELGADPEGVMPKESDLLEAARHCDISTLEISAEAGTAWIRDADASMDLGAVSKGFAAEKIAQELKSLGFSGYALNFGGNVRTVGPKPGGDPWVVGIQSPEDESGQSYFEATEFVDAALVTSGSYQRYFDWDGVRYHHIISPDTLYPENEYISVSIRSADSALADALSTAVFNMAPEEGFAFIHMTPGVEAFWILPDGSSFHSEGW